MRLVLLLAALVSTVSGRPESAHQSAVRVRELISYRSFGLGSLATTFKASHAQQSGYEDLYSLPITLQEYFAEWPDDSGDLVLLAMPVSTVFRNALPPNAPNVTLEVVDTYGIANSHPAGNLAAGRMRVALFGSIERVKPTEEAACKKVYLDAHPDAVGWVGSDGPHSNFFVKFTVDKVFDFGGFGDVSYIGWLDTDLYKQAGKERRSKDEVLNDWPEPIQPPPQSGVSLFSETTGSEKAEKARFKVQLTNE